MKALMDLLATDLAKHLAAAGFGSGILFFSFVQNMPLKPPTSMQEYWTWVRDSLRTVLPIRQKELTQPASTLQGKEK